MFENFSDRSAELIGLAKVEAHLMESPYVGTEHVLLALLKQENTGAAEILAVLVDPARVREELKKLIDLSDASQSPADPDEIRYSPRCELVFQSAGEFAEKLGDSEVAPEHVLLGLFYERTLAAEVFSRLGVGVDDVGRRVVARKKRGLPPPSGPVA